MGIGHAAARVEREAGKIDAFTRRMHRFLHPWHRELDRRVRSLEESARVQVPFVPYITPENDLADIAALPKDHYDNPGQDAAIQEADSTANSAAVCKATSNSSFVQQVASVIGSGFEHVDKTGTGIGCSIPRHSTVDFNIKGLVLPPRQLADSLLQCYWELFHPIYPVLHRPTFHDVYSQLWLPTELLGFTTHNMVQDVVFYSMLNIVLAIGCQRNEALTVPEREDLAGEFYRRSVNLVSMDALDTSSLQIVQLLILRGFYLLCTPHADRCWATVGVALRVAQAIGLQSAKPPEASSQLNREMRRRVWYNCFLLDWMTSLSFDRPRALSKDTSVPLPQLIDDEYLSKTDEGQQPHNIPSSLTFFVYAMKLLNIREKSLVVEAQNVKTNRVGYSGQELGATLDLISDLDNFLETLPTYLQLDHGHALLEPVDETCFRLQARVLKARVMYARLITFAAASVLAAAALCPCLGLKFDQPLFKASWDKALQIFSFHKAHVESAGKGIEALERFKNYIQLREATTQGTDSSQGKGQVISNINACLAVQETIRSTLGPYGGDLLLVDENGRQTITNDGATVMKLLDIVHPAARILTDIARSQDAEVGDGTTSVVVLAGEILKEIKEHVEQGVSSQTIIKGLRRASMMSVNKIKEIAVNTNEGNQRDTLSKLAGTAMSSKLIKRNTGFFTKMVVDAVLTLDQDDLNENLIGVKKIPGGSLTDSLFVNGVAFKKTFSYAGFEQQPKSFKNPKIVCLNVELELKSEKDNAEVRVEQVSEYQAIVDAEWQIIYNKMEALYKSGAKVVLSKLPIGDLATQYFADRDIFCAGRVASADLDRIIQACGGSIQSTCSDIHPEHLGICGRFEEKQIGNERFNFFEDCPEAKTCTLVLRGGAEQFIAEVERSLHDAIMIVKRAIKHNTIVAGGGACEMEISAYLHRYADKSISNKQQAIIKSFAKALEVIPRQLCDNAGFDATDILNKLRVEHRKGSTWAGVDFVNEGIADNMEKFVWEPALVKINAIQAATEASCLILSVDETIKNEESQAPQAPGQQLPPGAAQRALRGRGRGMPRR
ncbi:hypothetical protein VE03_06238 [Pseudogymnoascus sp. 23342-1-I1]|nr:hypothetical protein VE03_06238 [Pseudogymnoascus sp. 23342-1-I1]